MFAALFLVVATLPQPTADDLVVAADRLYVGNGQVLTEAIVVVRDGRIASVTQGERPKDAIWVQGAELTPGLIDAYSYVGPERHQEESREVTASHTLASTLNLGDPGFGVAAREGVTTLYLSPDPHNVVGGLGCIVKTAGGESSDLFSEPGGSARMMIERAALKVTLGSDPSKGNSPSRFGSPRSYKVRRPTTRMGVVWVVRKAFHDARVYRQARAGDNPPPFDPDLEVLASALAGEIPVRFQARRDHDIQTALRIAAEFGLPPIIEEGTEAHRVADLLIARGAPVLLGPAFDSITRSIASPRSVDELRVAFNPPPICCEDLEEPGFENHDHEPAALPRAVEDLLLATVPRYDDSAVGAAWLRSGEARRATPSTAALLAATGVPFAFGAAEGNGESSLIYQARTAVRWGLDPDAALLAATSQAAALLGIAEEVGTIEVGKSADLALWSGAPMRADSRLLLVLVDGKIVLQR